MTRRKWLYLLAAWTRLGLGCSRGRWSSGDRVVVSKHMYDTGISKPERFDVVVFKYPVRPIEKGVPKNYIKRLMGLPGQLLAILFGQLFFLDPEGETPLFPEPKVLVTKDGKTFKGFVDSETAEKVVFWTYEYGKTSKAADYFKKETFVRSAIESLEPIQVTERWKHRIKQPGPPEIRAETNEADFGNDFDFLYEDHPWALDWFQAGRFKPVRKPPDVSLAMRRIVYDNDFQPKDLVGERFQRWHPSKGSAWKGDGGTGFGAEAGAGGEVDWLTYRHLLVEGGAGRAGTQDPDPHLISDELGYNKVKTRDHPKGQARAINWVGDLMLECSLEVTEPKGEFWMELSRGQERFRARFDLEKGQCTLFRLRDSFPGFLEGDLKDSKPKEEELHSVAIRINAKGTYQVRFANFCSRLTVWIDRDLPFAHGHDYDALDLPRPEEKGLAREAFLAALADRRGPTKNDFERPASLGVKGASVQVKQVRLWRDTYYSRSDDQVHHEMGALKIMNFKKPWEDLLKLPPKCYYVQPGHYMCLGDNSPMSSDSRDWGLVPERLMLGRAHLVYYPFNRAGPIK